MGEGILNAVGDRLTTAIVLSAVVALAIVAVVALTWWWGRRWARKRTNAWSTNRISMGDRMTEPRVNEPSSETAPEPSSQARTSTGAEQWGSRLVRDTAARAAALRDTWDRSYQAARTGPGAAGTAGVQPGPTAGADPIAELVEEQRQMNALLREVLEELRQRR
jgi:hypothetical protein